MARFYVVGFNPSSPDDGLYWPIIEADNAEQAVLFARAYYSGDDPLAIIDAVSSQHLRDLADFLDHAFNADISVASVVFKAKGK